MVTRLTTAAAVIAASLLFAVVLVVEPPCSVVGVTAPVAASAPYLPTVSHASDVVGISAVEVTVPQTCDADGVCTDTDAGGGLWEGNGEGEAATTPPAVVPAGTSFLSDTSASSVAGVGMNADGENKNENEPGVDLMMGTPLSVDPSGTALAAAALSGAACTSLSGDPATACFGAAFTTSINTLRATSSRPPVAYNRRVSMLATAWSRTLQRQGKLRRADLSKQIGPPGTYVSGQNLALTPASVADPVVMSMRAWVARPGNRRLLLGGATHVGVGVLKGDDGRWWVSLFLATCFEKDPSACPADEAPRGGDGDTDNGNDGEVALDRDFEQPWLAMCKVSTCMRAGGEGPCWFVGETTCADFASRIECSDRFCEAGIPPAPVCGSNGITYENECLADVASCQQGFAFHIAKLSAC
ncbi:hypothetical protein MMPV_000826 [Pyropia vietnamensis]